MAGDAVWLVYLNIWWCLLYDCILFFFFFFQAEDGIRDLTVTGVQTCALPISTISRRRFAPIANHNAAGKHDAGEPQTRFLFPSPHPSPHRMGRGAEPAAPRSEEHTSELQSQSNLVCRLLLGKKKKTQR